MPTIFPLCADGVGRGADASADDGGVLPPCLRDRGGGGGGAGAAGAAGGPHGNSFQVHFAADRAAVETAASRMAREEGVWLVNRLVDTAWPGACYAEIVVAATMEWGAEEVAGALGRLLR